jgi:oxygen-independent coproporphyrinogen-3 oxidase
MIPAAAPGTPLASPASGWTSLPTGAPDVATLGEIPDSGRFRSVDFEISEATLERAEALLPRYTTAGPRYTSYPTAPVWSEAYGPEDFRAELGRRDVDPADGLSLYVHVPFCRSLCHFCACNRTITHKPELPARYLDALAREVAAIREAVAVPRGATQQHWGGGTPTHLTPAQVRRLFATVTDAFPMRPGAEISIEVDPRVTGEAHVDALRECGFDRISMGVQDFDPRVQQAIHRIQPVETTAALVERARKAGFGSVSLDLIYGLPFQSVESFARTLDAVLAIAPDRVALYGYAHVTWVAKQQRGFERHDLPDPATRLRIFFAALRRFLATGYVYVGMDHFARPGDELARALREGSLRRNFMGYTTQAGVDLLGFGPSAISELRGGYAQSHRELDAWEAAVEARGLATMRGHRLSEDDRIRRFVIARLMCLGEVRAPEFHARFGAGLAERLGAELGRLGPLAEDGVVEVANDGSVRVTPLGRLLVRNVAMVFDAYLPEQQRAERPLFSRTV